MRNSLISSAFQKDHSGSVMVEIVKVSINCRQGEELGRGCKWQGSEASGPVQGNRV